VQPLPFSQACENNRDSILSVLTRVFADCDSVLEIGSGTGQHATYFAGAMPWLQWHPSETRAGITVLTPRCQVYEGSNLVAPQVLEVHERPWQSDPLPDALFTANTLHIMPWPAVESLFAELRSRADRPARLAVYGPFNYGGQYTSDSNARFDEWLFQRDPRSAIRDFERVNELAGLADYRLLEDNVMPANNRLLVWLGS
jgi:hypothetical protein